MRIQPNTLSEPDDMREVLRCVELCREIGNSAPLARFKKREVMPGSMTGEDLQKFVRDAAVTYWHQSCTARIERDALIVVDGALRVHGIEGPRIADASVMPRMPTGNTMAPCVMIGEQAAAIIRA